jgi:hypothetical protein
VFDRWQVKAGKRFLVRDIAGGCDAVCRHGLFDGNSGACSPSTSLSPTSRPSSMRIEPRGEGLP